MSRSPGRARRLSIAAFAAIAWLVCPAAAPAQSGPQPTTKPFLWRIDGPAGSAPAFIYGTVHVPDARVLALPDVVQAALDASDGVFLELPLDVGTQASLLTKVMLPAGRTLQDVVGAELFGRLTEVIAQRLPKELPSLVTNVLAAQLGRMQPWAALSQVLLLDYLPDVLAGRQPLDMMLWSMAADAGKRTGGLETVDEQVGAFSAFTDAEQAAMMRSTLDEMSRASKAGKGVTSALVDTYLGGDLERLFQESTRDVEQEPALRAKFLESLVYARNRRLTERMLARRTEQPGRTLFFAVGALHYQGEQGILALLAKRGLKVTRLGPQDAALLRKKAA